MSLKVLFNGQNGRKEGSCQRSNESNAYFYRWDFFKIHFLTSRLRNYINIVQTWKMADYLLTEVELSHYEIQDKEVIRPTRKEDLEFLNDDCDQDKVDFYQSVDKKNCWKTREKYPFPS